jgi:hypothetical protein
MIDDEGWIYVNGKLAGESHDWSSPVSIDVMKFLHAGNNAIAVVVKNNEGIGGIGNGARLDLVNAAMPASWQRHAFNGLAQVIVQAGRESGAIKLTATAEGLSASDTVVTVEPNTGHHTVP